MDECLDFMASAPDALPSDEWLCHLVRSQHILEEVSQSFGLDDPMSQANLTDWKTRNMLKHLTEKWEEWRSNVTPEMPQSKSLVLNSVHSDFFALALVELIDANGMLYIHEIAMHLGNDDDDFRPPFFIDPNKPQVEMEAGASTAAHISSLTICLQSIHRVIEAILAENINNLRTFPTLVSCLSIIGFSVQTNSRLNLWHRKCKTVTGRECLLISPQVFVRVLYACTAFAKLGFLVNAPGSPLSSVFTREDLRLEYYFDRLVAKLVEAGENGNHRIVGVFSRIVSVMRVWLLRNLTSKSGKQTSQDRAQAKDKGIAPTSSSQATAGDLTPSSVSQVPSDAFTSTQQTTYQPSDFAFSHSSQPIVPTPPDANEPYQFDLNMDMDWLDLEAFSQLGNSDMDWTGFDLSSTGSIFPGSGI